MKLKRVDREKDGWQKCCRYCHYYSKGKCWNKDLSIICDDITNVYKISEEGFLSQTLEETLNEEDLIKEFMISVEGILDKWNISQKRKKEFEEHFKQCWSEFSDFQLKEELDEQVSNCYQNPLLDMFNGIEISDPEIFCCKEWC